MLSLLRRVAKSEGYAEEAQAQLDALQEVFSKGVAADLEHFRDLVKRDLESEIVLDACMQKGAIKRIVGNDRDVKRAVEILKNKDEYNKILGK